MKPYFAAFSFILLSLAAGCLEKAQEPGILFVCPEGKIVSNSSDCPIMVVEAVRIPESLPKVVLAAEEKQEMRISVDYGSLCMSLGCGNGTRFIGNKKTGKYHACDCRFALNMSPANRVCLSDSGQAAALNYSACRVCKPA